MTEKLLTGTLSLNTTNQPTNLILDMFYYESFIPVAPAGLPILVLANCADHAFLAYLTGILVNPTRARKCHITLVCKTHA